jgi:hypothetical protein
MKKANSLKVVFRPCEDGSVNVETALRCTGVEFTRHEVKYLIKHLESQK